MVGREGESLQTATASTCGAFEGYADLRVHDDALRVAPRKRADREEVVVMSSGGDSARTRKVVQHFSPCATKAAWIKGDSDDDDDSDDDNERYWNKPTSKLEPGFLVHLKTENLTDNYKGPEYGVVKKVGPMPKSGGGIRGQRKREIGPKVWWVVCDAEQLAKWAADPTGKEEWLREQHDPPYEDDALMLEPFDASVHLDDDSPQSSGPLALEAASAPAAPAMAQEAGGPMGTKMRPSEVAGRFWDNHDMAVKPTAIALQLPHAPDSLCMYVLCDPIFAQPELFSEPIACACSGILRSTTLKSLGTTTILLTRMPTI